MKTEKLIASRYIHTLIAVFFASGTIIAWSQSDVSPSATAAAGSPLRGLTTAQLADFADGLGPIFNNDSCAACHFKPAVGGSSAILETRFGRTVNGHFDPLSAEGGSLLQLFAINKAAQEVIPTDANVIAQRQTTPLFGLGLIEAIPDSAILEIAARSKPDGIFGRPSMVVDIVTGQTRVGRFGWKAQQATLLAFSGDAYLNEIGITSRLFPQENAPNGNTDLLQKFDKVPDPEDVVDPATGKAGIDHFTDFMRFLAPLPVPALTDSATVGSIVFATIGCANCHTPVMFTGANLIRALDSKAVPLFSDLLLHDMGSLGDGIAQADAEPGEMRTSPLWGLRASGPYLHDGRASTPDDAIRAHDGEGKVPRDRFVQLSPALRKTLLDYLNSL